MGMAGFTLLSIFSLCGICNASDRSFNGNNDDSDSDIEDVEKNGPQTELPERAKRYSIQEKPRMRSHDLD